jgi:hypothetical protein
MWDHMGFKSIRQYLNFYPNLVKKPLFAILRLGCFVGTNLNHLGIKA